MNQFLRAFAVVLTCAPLVISAGCSGGGGEGGDGGSGSTGATAAGPGSTGATTGSSAAGPGSTSATTGSSASGPSSSGTGAGSISWAGTWSVHLQYSVDCDYSFGNIKHADVDQTNTMVLDSNGNGGLTADIMDYPMSGTGNATSLSLSGQYPLQDEGGNVASNVQSENNITLSVTSVVDDNHAGGAVSGKYTGNFGQHCTIATGTTTLSR